MSVICQHFHEVIQQLQTYKYPFYAEFLPQDGLLLLFEEGEVGHNDHRLVYAGIHNGMHQLYSRIVEHYENENKDRSILRKHIGRAFLNKANDPFLVDWNLDLTSRRDQELHAAQLNTTKLQEVETQVTDYLRKNTWIAVLPIPDYDNRRFFKSRIVASVVRCEECGPSVDWLGHFSPSQAIRLSGLWHVQGLNDRPFTHHELRELQQRLR